MGRFVRTTCIILLLTVAASSTFATTSSDKKTTNILIPPPRRDVPGKHFSLTLGKLYVPDFFSPEAAASTDVVFFFHGASWCSEQNFYDARKNAVLVSVSLKDYEEVFRNPDSLSRLLNETLTTLAEEDITSKPLGKICLSSFSGGYTAIRAILRNQQLIDRISDIVLADSLYAPRVEGAENQLDPDSMAPFLQYARRAAAGECTFWFSHLYPPEERDRSNTTTLAANYLIDRIGADRQPASSRSSRGEELLYRADKGDFHVLGYAGMTTQDHFEHFYALSDLIKQTSLSAAPEKNP